MVRRRRGYYRPLSGRRLRRKLTDMLLPWWLRWLLGIR